MLERWKTKASSRSAWAIWNPTSNKQTCKIKKTQKFRLRMFCCRDDVLTVVCCRWTLQIQIQIPRLWQQLGPYQARFWPQLEWLHCEKTVFLASCSTPIGTLEKVSGTYEESGESGGGRNKTHDNGSYLQRACTRLTLLTKSHKRRRDSGVHTLLLKYWLLLNSWRERTAIFSVHRLPSPPDSCR